MSAGTDSQVLKRLEELEETAAPAGLLEFYRKLLRIQIDAGSRISGPELNLDKEAADSRISRGVPLLTFDDLGVDWELAIETFDRTVALLAGYPGLFGGVAELQKFDRERLQAETRAWFEDKPLQDGEDGLERAALDLAIHASLRPFLVRAREALDGLVEQEKWRRGHCPVCGGSPDFAFLEKDGARWLICSRCDARWLFQRLECPYCGNQDQKKLSYFTDEEGLYRLYVCEQCRRYLKAADLRRAASGVLLPVERYLTLHLDAQARVDGYSPYAKRG